MKEVSNSVCVCVCVCVRVIVCVQVLAENDKLRAQVAQLQSQLDKATKQIRELEEQLAEVGTRYSLVLVYRSIWLGLVTGHHAVQLGASHSRIRIPTHKHARYRTLPGPAACSLWHPYLGSPWW